MRSVRRKNTLTIKDRSAGGTLMRLKGEYYHEQSKRKLFIANRQKWGAMILVLVALEKNIKNAVMQ